LVVNGNKELTLLVRPWQHPGSQTPDWYKSFDNVEEKMIGHLCKNFWVVVVRYLDEE